MKKIATLEQWGDSYRLITTFERTSRKKRYKNWTETLCCTENRIDEFFPEMYFEESPKDWTSIQISEQLEWSDRHESNLIRRRRQVREYALCNKWTYFATFTLAESKANRFDLGSFYKRFGEWVGNYNKRFGTSLKYLIIPEQHKNGAWHAHGLLAGVATDSIITNKYGYLDMPYYAQRFGFISLSPVRNNEAAAKYITKYITKETDCTALEKNRKGYLHSRGLAKAVRISECVVPDDFPSAWSNAWCGISWGSVSEYKPVDIIAAAARGENLMLQEHEEETVTERLRALQEWKAQYNEKYTQPLVYDMRVDILGKGE